MTYLRSNARENLTKLSRMTHIPVSTIFDRLREYESEIISKHTTLLDFKKLGFDIKINILFKIARGSRDDFKEFLVKNHNINSVFRVNNGYDYLVEAIFRGMHELQEFMGRYREVQYRGQAGIICLGRLEKRRIHGRCYTCRPAICKPVNNG